MKKIGVILLISVIPISILSVLYAEYFSIVFLVAATIYSFVAVPVGFCLLIFRSKSTVYKNIYLAIGLFLIVFGFISKEYHIPGASIELIVGIVWFCFAYSPIQLRDKYEKWLPFSKSPLESFLLSAVDYIGLSTFAIGCMFKIQKWPFANTLVSIGLSVLLLGLIAWNFKFKKEVIKRKQAEDKITLQHQEILDSINYAKRIQKAILPSDRVVNSLLPDSFILYKPKDIVAGDFYWLEPYTEVSGTKGILFAAADCTGHGVPGAMVSVVCNNALNRSVREFGLNDPGKILDKTREIVIAEFEKSDEDVKDGMDISLISFAYRADNESEEKTNPCSHTVTWSGANNPLWIVRNDAHLIEEIKADKQPIGKYTNAKPFTTHTLELKKGDTIYIFTDGFQDQFGGESLAKSKTGGKKFKAARLKELLLANSKKPMKEQALLLDQEFELWKGNLEQLDDVCVIGVRV